MPIELIISLSLLALLTLAGALVYIFKYSKEDSKKPLWQRIFLYIYHIVLGAPYIVMLGILWIVYKIRNRK